MACYAVAGFVLLVEVVSVFTPMALRVEPSTVLTQFSAGEQLWFARGAALASVIGMTYWIVLLRARSKVFG